MYISRFYDSGYVWIVPNVLHFMERSLGSLRVFRDGRQPFDGMGRLLMSICITVEGKLQQQTFTVVFGTR